MVIGGVGGGGGDGGGDGDGVYNHHLYRYR